MKIYNLFDRKAGGISKRFFSINAQTAIREVSEVIQEKQLAHFEDLELFETGDQDDETMLIVGHQSPKHIINLGELAPIEAING